MDKRLAKQHKRKVARAKERIKVSEPDVRTQEQIEAAREASRPAGGHLGLGNVKPRSAGSSKAPGTGSAAKTDA